MALPNSRIRVTPEEYLRLEELAEFKSEFVDGVIYAMSGASPRHSAIAVNLIGSLAPQLRGTLCRAFSNDTKVSTPADSLYAYPDLTIVCGQPVFVDERGYVLANPTLIVEILSPSTERFDRVGKFARYRQIPSLTDYLLVAQAEPMIEHHIRQPNESWLEHFYAGLSSSVTFTNIGCTLLLADVYDRVEFDQNQEPGGTVQPF